ncbi:CheC, inhibitor of MCP methylation [Rippkaea orientalis PCC 8801]|uniref:CheC, inhibitor of MCP methylation n=1 Tax=Rippkaea orientalis (strain PCC 8801 / RF-1) TaxID=41431 RepID=B7JZR1_RIPO1|nr:chemotaxis protein CheC [Rippkaea orientalis]ACK65004.1 CheC, inhibitor of MCP methylation [Rippkaea orientalis PCC 8801]
MKTQIDSINILQEVINIGVGQAASILNEMIGFHIDLQIPLVQILSFESAKKELEKRLGTDNLSTVELRFTGTLQGSADLVFPTDSASKLVDLVTDETSETSDLDLLKIGVLTEIGNIVISGIMGVISNLLKQEFHYFIPNYIEGNIEQFLDDKDNAINTTILLARANFFIKKMNIRGDIIIIFNLGSFDNLISAIEKFYDQEIMGDEAY